MSFNLDTSFLLNDKEFKTLLKQIDRPASDTCGICNEKNASVFWPSPVSRWAHYECMNQISPAESNLLKTINELFQNDRRRQSMLRQCAAKAVIEKCKPDTIAEFTKKNGIEAVTQLFNTVGIGAAKELARQISEHDQCDDLKNLRMSAALMSAITEFGFVSPRL